MIQNLLNNNLYWEYLVIILMIWYFTYKLLLRRIQKKYWYDNFEIWIFTALNDHYKNLGYPNSEKKAHEELNLIISRQKKECQTTEK